MSKASNEDLGHLHGAIARGLTDVIENGEVIGMMDDGVTPLKKGASAAYFMAGITLLKNNNITSDPTKNAELAGLQDAMAMRRAQRKRAVNGLDDAVKQAQDHLDHILGNQADGILQ